VVAQFLLNRSGRPRTLPRRFRRRRRNRSFGRHKYDNIRIFGGEESMWNGDVIDDNGGDDSWMRDACLTRQILVGGGARNIQTPRNGMIYE
jgi:hypothetical protein